MHDDDDPDRGPLPGPPPLPPPPPDPAAPELAALDLARVRGLPSAGRAGAVDLSAAP